MDDYEDELYDIEEFSLRHMALTLSMDINEGVDGEIKTTQGVSKVDRVIKDANKIKNFLGANKRDAQIKLLTTSKETK